MAVAGGFRLGKRGLPADDDWYDWQMPNVHRQCCKQAAAGKPRPRPDPMSDTQFDLEAISHWLCQEVQLRPSPGTIWQHQDEVTCSMRFILVDWLSQVCEHLHQQREVIFLAVNFLDRFLSCCRVARAEFQLLGIACLWVAAKYEAVHPPQAKLLIKMTNSIYRLPQLLEMEGKLLSALGFRLGAPTPSRFLDYYVQKAGPISSTVRLLAEQFLDMAVMVYPYGGDALAPPPATPPTPLSAFHEQAWAAAPTDDGSQDEDATLDAILLQRAGSCCSTTSTEVSYPTTCFQAACPSDSDEVEDAGSLPPASQESPAAPGRSASASATIAANGGGAGTLSKATGFPQDRQEVDFMLVATALPSQLAAAALCAAMEARQMRAQGLLLAVAKLAECDALSIWKLSQALIQLKAVLPSVAAPMCCTFVKRHRDARARLRQAIGMTIDLT